jgi:hypothetical protein
MSSWNPPSTYLHSSIFTAENRNGTAIDAHMASTTLVPGCVSCEKYTVCPRSVQNADTWSATGLLFHNSPKVISLVLNFLKIASDMALLILFIGTIPKLFKKFLIFGFMSWPMRTLSAKSSTSGTDPS